MSAAAATAGARSLEECRTGPYLIGRLVGLACHLAVHRRNARCDRYAHKIAGGLGPARPLSLAARRKVTSASADGGPRVPPEGEALRFIRQVRTGTVHIAAWVPEEPWHAGWAEPDAVQDWGQAMAEWVTSPGQPMLCGYRLKHGGARLAWRAGRRRWLQR